MTTLERQIEQDLIGKLGELKYTSRPDIRDRALCGNITFAEGEFYATEHAVVAAPCDGINLFPVLTGEPA